MEQREISFDSLNDPTLNPIHRQSIIHYQNNPSNEQISYGDQPPPYHSIYPNNRSLNTYAQVPLKNNRSCCCRNRCAIITIVVISIIILAIFLPILFTVILRGIPCDKPSASGKSCRRPLPAVNVQLLQVSTAVGTSNSTWGVISFLVSRFKYFSFSYVGKSNSDVITFTFEKGSRWYVDDISVIDTSTSAELVDNGGFETGSVNTYCVCPAMTGPPSSTTSTKKSSGSYGFDASNFHGETKLSQVLETIPGRNYVVSFTLYNNAGSQMTVHMSDTNRNSFSLILLLISFLIIIWNYFY